MESYSYNDRSGLLIMPSACLSPICSTSLRLILREFVGLLQWMIEGGLLLFLLIGATLFLSPPWSYMMVSCLVFFVFGATIIQLLKVKRIF